MSVLSPQESHQFYRDGYLRFREVIPRAQVERLRAALDDVITEELDSAADLDRPPEFRFGHDRNGQDRASSGRDARAIHQFVNMWKVRPEYRETIHNPTITGAIRELMGADQVRLWHDQVISKPPGDNKKFAFHHDFYFWPMERPTMISCWLALDDARVDNGCMHVIPGSHRDPRYQPAGCDLSADIHLDPVSQGPGEPASLYDAVRTWDADRAKPVEIKAGECMFHHCLNYHMTPENVTDRPRRAFVMIYMPDGARYNHRQSPGHCCTQYLHLPDGQPFTGDLFPICGE